MGSADPPGKTDKKLKSGYAQKKQFSEWGAGWGDKIFFASRGNGALTPLTKIPRTLVFATIVPSGG